MCGETLNLWNIAFQPISSYSSLSISLENSENQKFSVIFKVYPSRQLDVKISYRKIRTRCEICLKLTIMTTERRHWCRSGVFIVNFEHISHLVLVFLLLTLNIQIPDGVFRTCQTSMMIFLMKKVFSKKIRKRSKFKKNYIWN